MTKRVPGGLGRREDYLPATGSSPFTMMSRFWNDMDRLFDDFGFGRGAMSPFGRAFGGSEAGGSMWPSVDVVQRDDAMVICADLPGLKRDDVKVHVEDGMIVLSGERRSEHEGDERGMRRIERSYGRFQRVIPLPEGVKEDEVRASFRDGVLEITAPLAEARPRGRQIEIQQEAGEPESRGRAAAGGRRGNGGEATMRGEEQPRTM